MSTKQVPRGNAELLLILFKEIDLQLGLRSFKGATEKVQKKKVLLVKSPPNVRPILTLPLCRPELYSLFPTPAERCHDYSRPIIKFGTFYVRTFYLAPFSPGGYLPNVGKSLVWPLG